MDYCYACRRHLNGAYNCPGCGTPVDELVVPGAGDTSELPTVGDAETASADGSPPGRAARRADGPRRGGHKDRRGRRRAAFCAVGAVAVAGALAVFATAALSDSGGHPPTTPGIGAGPPSSDITSSAPRPDDAGLLPSTPGSDDPSGSVSPSPSTALPPSTASTVGSTTAPPVRTTSAKPTTTSPAATPSHTATATATGTATVTSTRSATPSPSQSTCQQVLLWCS